jgi:glutathione reductase (NADPH)
LSAPGSNSINRALSPWNIYAVGDCTDRMQLTPVAIAEGQAVAETLFHGNPKTPDYENVPTAVFSQPPIGTVGLTEAQARERYPAIDVYQSNFRPLKHTLSGRDEHSFMKLVVDRETDRVLGCHMLGTDAGEIIQGLAIALKCGATKAQFDATIGTHPTAAEEFVTLRNKS